MVDAWKRYAPLMRSGRDKDPYLGEYFEWLAVCLEERMRTAPRVPAHRRLPRRLLVVTASGIGPQPDNCTDQLGMIECDT